MSLGRRLFSRDCGGKRASEDSNGVEAGLGGESLRERGKIAVGQIEIDSLDAMHGKENHTRRNGLAFLDHGEQIVERGQFDSA